MKACLLRTPAPVEHEPLEFAEVPRPTPGAGQVLVRVRACGVCRTDLHVVEGDLAPRKAPVIPGHQVVGVVEELGPGARRFQPGDRVGIAWLHSTCGECAYCRTGKENLCERAVFTGYVADGGYAEYVAAQESFVYAIPEHFADLEAAPLLCAGIIGFRSLRLAEVGRGRRLGMYGFGAAAHVAVQVARHWGAEVFAFSRDVHHRRLALEMGAVWGGDSFDRPPAEIDSAIIFAPAGELVPQALRVLKRGGVVVLAGIHMSPIPSMEYGLLYHERMVRSVANNTRQDGEDFLRVAAEIPVRTRVRTFPLREANEALRALKHDEIRGAAVLRP